jgi:hypothetical protein
MPHTRVGTGNVQDRDDLRRTAEWHLDARNLRCARKVTKHPICRRQDRRRPAELSQRGRQVTDDIADAADLAARECAVLRGDEECALAVDTDRP